MLIVCGVLEGNSFGGMPAFGVSAFGVTADFSARFGLKVLKLTDHAIFFLIHSERLREEKVRSKWSLE